MDVEQIADLLYKKQKSMVYDDILRGLTAVGPHRDDLELSLDGNNMRLYASQGQQRSAVLALKQAELSIVREETGDTPVLLLDDVMSELDTNRRASLLDGMRDAQVFVTCTEAEQFDDQWETLAGRKGDARSTITGWKTRRFAASSLPRRARIEARFREARCGIIMGYFNGWKGSWNSPCTFTSAGSLVSPILVS
jgi:hypothetical protein